MAEYKPLVADGQNFQKRADEIGTRLCRIIDLKLKSLRNLLELYRRYRIDCVRNRATFKYSRQNAQLIQDLLERFS